MSVNSYLWNDIKVGQQESIQVRITSTMLKDFIELTGDINPLHSDPSYAISLGYKSQVIHGCLTNSFVSTLVGTKLPGKHCLILSLTSNFLSPIYIDDSLTYTGEVLSKSDSTQTLEIKVHCSNQEGKKVLKSKVLVQLKS